MSGSRAPAVLLVIAGASLAVVTALALVRPRVDSKVLTTDPPSLATPPPQTNQPLATPRGRADYPLADFFIPASRSNYDWNRMGQPELVVVHTMEGYYFGTQHWFLNPQAQVSAQFLVRSDDGEITQMVSLYDKAWHVGSANARAVGIEHE
ncbi:MAG: N-acetylmuramoyl-L-alanine amidase, partial [Myxococcales bacterium]|nr:N-acetylmuramoyl-L-alanine amidase [Myxococcales bacterium]